MQIAEINARAQSDPAGFVRECDAGLDARIHDAAAHVAGNIENSRIVLLSGPSGSGKTTTALKIAEALHAFDIHAHVVSLDNYFLDIDPLTSPRAPDGQYDFESPHCLDMTLLNRHFDIIDQGGEIEIPRFDFTEQKRSPKESAHLRLTGREVLVVEGIHAENPAIADRQPKAAKIFVSTTANARLIRRMIRDNKFRGAPAAYTLSLWGNVRRNEEKHILPLRQRADICIDTTLLYEPCVLRPFAELICREVTPDADFYDLVQQILKRFSEYAVISTRDLPHTSLLREFIGGSRYKY